MLQKALPASILGFLHSPTHRDLQLLSDLAQIRPVEMTPEIMPPENPCIHVSSPCFSPRYHCYRTLACTASLHVPLPTSSLQNLTIHAPSPCPSPHPTATEPYNTRSISMFLSPSHRYRTYRTFLKSAIINHMKNKIFLTLH